MGNYACWWSKVFFGAESIFSHPSWFFAILQLCLITISHRLSVVFDNFCDAGPIEDHFLVMASALVSIPRSNSLWHGEENLFKLSLQRSLHELRVGLKKANVSLLLLIGPFSFSEARIIYLFLSQSRGLCQHWQVMYKSIGISRAERRMDEGIVLAKMKNREFHLLRHIGD